MLRARKKWPPGVATHGQRAGRDTQASGERRLAVHTTLGCTQPGDSGQNWRSAPQCSWAMPTSTSVLGYILADRVADWRCIVRKASIGAGVDSLRLRQDTPSLRCTTVQCSGGFFFVSR